jgi:hypothetical protein
MDKSRKSVTVSVARTILCASILFAFSGWLNAEIFNGINFPHGTSSFADAVIVYDPLFSGGPAASLPPPLAPINAIGPPNFVLPADHISLGSGGLIELAFLDNFLINSGTVQPDLYVGEHLGTAERFFVAIRPTAQSAVLLNPALDANHDGYFELGAFTGSGAIGDEGSVALINIDAVFSGFGPGQLRFEAIQIIDDRNEGANLPSGTVGMDLEAVGAISSAPVPEPSTLLLAFAGLIGLLCSQRQLTRGAAAVGIGPRPHNRT